MKRSLMVILSFLWGTALQAEIEDSFLFWMIDPNATIVGNWGVETRVDAGKYYARVGYADSGTTADQLMSTGLGDHYLNLYAAVDDQSPVPIYDNVGLDASNIRTYTPDEGGPLGVQSAPVYAGLPPAVTAANYTYWIELLNADNNSVAGYGSLGMYQDLAAYISSMQGMATPDMMKAVSAFAAPEPNSALLLLIGCAALALRRRKQIAA